MKQQKKNFGNCISEPHIIYKQPGNIIVSRQATLQNIWADTQKLLHFYFVHMAFEHYNLCYQSSLVQMDFYNILLIALQVLQINKNTLFRGDENRVSTGERCQCTYFRNSHYKNVLQYYY